MQYILDSKELKEHVKRLHRTHGAVAGDVVVPEDSTNNAVQR